MIKINTNYIDTVILIGHSPSLPGEGLSYEGRPPLWEQFQFTDPRMLSPRAKT